MRDRAEASHAETELRVVTSVPKPQSWRPLRMAVVGGLFFSTFLTLVLVPVVYVLLGRFTKVKQRDGAGPAENVERPVAENVQVPVG